MTDLPFDFAADREKATITIRRDFAAPRDFVWDCYTKAELLEKWFAPAPMTTRTKVMDFREGGQWHFAMVTPDGDHYWNRVDYQSITPIDAMTYLDGFSDEEGHISPDMPRSECVVRFEDSPVGTTVRTLVQYTSSEDVDKSVSMGLEQGLAATYAVLDDLIARPKQQST